MSARRSFTTVLLTLVGIVVLLGVTYLLPLMFEDNGNPITPSGIPETPSPGTDSPEIVIQPFTHTITDQGVLKFEIYAERAEKYQKNKAFLLKKIQKAVFYGKDDRQYELTAQTGHWDESKQMVIVEGDIVCKVIEEGNPDQLELTCQYLTYDINLKTMEGYGAVRANYSQYQTTGEKLTVNLNLNLVTLEDNIITQIGPGVIRSEEINPGIPVIAKARKAIYHIKNQVLDYLGDPEVFWGSDNLMAGQLHFDFVQKRFSGLNGVTVEFAPGPSAQGPEPVIHVTASNLTVDLVSRLLDLRDNVAIRQGIQYLFSDSFTCVFNESKHQIEAVKAAGGVEIQHADLDASCSGLIVNLPGETAQLSGDAAIRRTDGSSVEAMMIQIKYGSRVYQADEQVKLVIPGRNSDHPTKGLGLFSMTQSKQPQVETQIFCNQALLDERSGHISAVGDVRGVQGDNSFSSESLNIEYEPVSREFQRLEAVGKVQLSESGRILTGDKLIYTSADRRAILSGNATFWETKNSLRADRFEYVTDREIIEAFGNVAGVLTSGTPVKSGSVSTPASDRRETHVAAQYASFDQRQNLAVFRDQVLINQGLYELKAETVSVFIDPVTQTIRNADAQGKVELRQDGFHATGSSLTYSAGDSIIVLKGSDAEKCRIWQGERGAEAEEIKVFVDENRFTIEKGLSVIMPSQLGGAIR